MTASEEPNSLQARNAPPKQKLTSDIAPCLDEPPKHNLNPSGFTLRLWTRAGGLS
jgi:hypothetical protein